VDTNSLMDIYTNPICTAAFLLLTFIFGTMIFIKVMEIFGDALDSIGNMFKPRERSYYDHEHGTGVGIGCIVTIIAGIISTVIAGLILYLFFGIK